MLGCRHLDNNKKPIDDSKNITQIGLVEDRRINLSKFNQIAVYKNISGFINNDLAQVQFYVRAQKYSVRWEDGSSNPPPHETLYESDKYIYVKACDLFRIINEYVRVVSDDYGYDEPYFPKRIFIDYAEEYNPDDSSNYTVKTLWSIVDIWHEILKCEISNPEETEN